MSKVYNLYSTMVTWRISLCFICKTSLFSKKSSKNQNNDNHTRIILNMIAWYLLYVNGGFLFMRHEWVTKKCSILTLIMTASCRFLKCWGMHHFLVLTLLYGFRFVSVCKLSPTIFDLSQFYFCLIEILMSLISKSIIGNK